MVNDYIDIFSKLTTIGILNHNVQWSSSRQFAQHNIKMTFHSTIQRVKVLDLVVVLIVERPEEYCCVFVGSNIKSHHLAKQLENKLNNKLLTVDAIHVHGSLQKSEKFWCIRIFCSKVNQPCFSGRIRVPAGLANVGINNSLVKYVLNITRRCDVICSGNVEHSE
jgi:superfamily II DNA/RNA helicase